MHIHDTLHITNYTLHSTHYSLYTIHIHMHMYIQMHACTHRHTYIHPSVRPSIHPYKYRSVHLCAYIHTCIHTSIHPCMHACIHTYIRLKLRIGGRKEEQALPTLKHSTLCRWEGGLQDGIGRSPDQRSKSNFSKRASTFTSITATAQTERMKRRSKNRQTYVAHHPGK